MLEKTPRVRVWSAAEKEKVKDLFLEGYSDAEIAHILGRTVIAVGLQRHYMKLRKAQQPHKEFVIQWQSIIQIGTKNTYYNNGKSNNKHLRDSIGDTGKEGGV